MLEILGLVALAIILIGVFIGAIFFGIGVIGSLLWIGIKLAFVAIPLSLGVWLAYMLFLA